MNFTGLLLTMLRRALSLADVGVYRLSESLLDPADINTLASADRFYSSSLPHLRQRLSRRRRLFVAVLDLVAPRLHLLPPGSMVCDAGCGTGDLLWLLHDRHPNLAFTGFEFSSAARERTRRLCPWCRVAPFDLTADIADEEQFDVVFCLQVLEHLHRPDVALRSLLKLTTASGMLVLTVPDGRNDTFGGHINFWSPTSLRVFLDLNAIGVPVEISLLPGGGRNLCAVLTRTRPNTILIPQA